MRRTPIVLAATVAGVAGTLGFKTQEPTATTTAAVSSTDTGTASAASGSTSTGSSSTGSSSTSGSSSSSGSSTTEKASATSSASTTVTSDVISTQYGNVELKVTVKDGKITAVENVQLPANDPHSVQINNSAGPILQESALSNADGTIDAVSGATYTANGYQQALQSALDKANSSASSSATTS
jgi:uncharacterized protein with FMN-binding domain